MFLFRRSLRLILIIPLILTGVVYIFRPFSVDLSLHIASYEWLQLFEQQLQDFVPPWAHSTISLLFSQEAPSVVLRQGNTVIGTIMESNLPRPVEAFLGIPYALPPTGERRFRPPEPVNVPEGVIYAQSYGKSCPSGPLAWLKAIWSEDCLNLNIFRPRMNYTTTKLPVAVYIHGGAFNMGAGRYHNSASMMAWSENPYIAVNFNHRLGAFGFLGSDAAFKDGSLNAGLHDQALLLKWVQDNIEAFGGDPKQVTLFGLSAGAHSVGHHVMHHDESSPLFQRVMIESGAATSRAIYPYNNPLTKNQTEEFLFETGCQGLPEQETMPCLRRASPVTIGRASWKIFARYGKPVRWPFQPVIDGDIIPRAPIRAWESGRWNKVPILTGFNTNEGCTFVPTSMSESHEFIDFFRILIPAMSEDDLNALDLLYPDPLKFPDSPYVETRPISVGPQFKRVEAAYAHFAYICPVRQTAHLASAGQDAPVYLYHWALNKTVQNGANHADQVEYEVYSPGVRNISPAQAEIAGILHAYFTSFITTGDPNAVKGRFPDRPTWSAFDNSNGKNKVMLFGEGNDERAGGGGVGVPAQLAEDVWPAKECEFWSKRSILTES
ncbi:hypothetical protein AJ80_00498 [Polytolypa hystricis UAMH7299]|uniref:Carboxylic ester hydrolase n=1 Tax=Polytolypa hystricis (strain UAMH7299) TaxID=1447883 RepID=A0A2B7Z2X4_POLH7|nr:hypothetical protein AJ80_00498 [Polytolypa hystricis UAMH7299]